MLDQYLKTFHFSEYHGIFIQSDARVIYPLIKTINFKKSKLIRLLFTLRGLPQKMDSIDGFLAQGFILLEEKADAEIIIGFLLGVPLRPVGPIEPSRFAAFKDPKVIKGVWNFKLQKAGSSTLLSTETRVFCPSRVTKLFFAFYWFFIAYFSGLVRMEILKLVKNEAERISKLIRAQN